MENDVQPRIILNGAPTITDLENATVVEEHEQSVSFAILQNKEGGKRAQSKIFSIRKIAEMSDWPSLPRHHVKLRLSPRLHQLHHE